MYGWLKIRELYAVLDYGYAGVAIGEQREREASLNTYHEVRQKK